MTTTTTVVTGEGDAGVTAVALYDYQAAAEDEISFDPNDIITNIEMVSFLGKFVWLSFTFVYLSRLKVLLFLVLWQ